MKALVYTGVGSVELQDRPRPQLLHPTDAIVRMTKTTICGSDLHIQRGHITTTAPGRIIGHEGVGVVEELGSAVSSSSLTTGDTVLIPAITSCAVCRFCRKGMYSHCSSGEGGWVLGNTTDGTQAELVRIPHAGASLVRLAPADADQDAVVLLSDALPTGYECGVLNGKVRPGSAVAVVGAGPVGLAVVLAARLFSPSVVVAVDNDENRLAAARRAGATHACTSAEARDVVASVTVDGQGCDSVVEAVGVPATFELAQRLLAPGGTLANVGVHGTPATIFLQDLWSRNVTITTQLVDTVSLPVLLGLYRSGKLELESLITHRRFDALWLDGYCTFANRFSTGFPFKDIEQAYSIFGSAAEHKCLKVLIEMG